MIYALVARRRVSPDASKHRNLLGAFSWGVIGKDVLKEFNKLTKDSAVRQTPTLRM
jgi:hypothetical protein